MLEIVVSRIPAGGRVLDEGLTPEGLGVDGQEGFDLGSGGRIEGHVERGDDDSVHVTGRITARLGLVCDRCARAYEQVLDQRVDLYSLPHRADVPVEDEDEVELSDRDMVVSYHREDRLPLGDLVREQLVLAVPMARLCRVECRGLCSGCGADRNETTCDCQVEQTGSPFAALKGIVGGGSR